MTTQSTRSEEYTHRLATKEAVWWKRLLDVQAPYRWNMRRLSLGFTLDVGCGLGRNLVHINGNGVGIDHSASSVEVARSRGLKVFLPDEFDSSQFNRPASFDSILFAHVLEHMTEEEAALLLTRYVPLLKPSGLVVLITPQERGFKSDQTHIQFMDFRVLRRICERAGLSAAREFSFPFPRFAGPFFTYNEFVFLGRKLN